jgi:hypothetical protein
MRPRGECLSSELPKSYPWEPLMWRLPRHRNRNPGHSSKRSCLCLSRCLKQLAIQLFGMPISAPMLIFFRTTTRRTLQPALNPLACQINSRSGARIRVCLLVCAAPKSNPSELPKWPSRPRSHRRHLRYRHHRFRLSVRRPQRMQTLHPCPSGHPPNESRLWRAR